MSGIIKITVINGETGTESFTFEKEKISVGRDPKSDLVIDDIEISRNHLIITKDEGSYFAKDLNSTNGSFIDEKQLKGKLEIVSGDHIRLGKDHVLEFLFEADSQETEPAPAPDIQASDAAPVEAVAVKKIAQRTKVDGKKKVKLEKPKQAKAKKPTWLIILLTALAFIVIFCLVPLVVIEVTNQWCNLFAGFFNSMSPGVCP